MGDADTPINILGPLRVAIGTARNHGNWRPGGNKITFKVWAPVEAEIEKLVEKDKMHLFVKDPRFTKNVYNSLDMWKKNEERYIREYEEKEGEKAKQKEIAKKVK